LLYLLREMPAVTSLASVWSASNLDEARERLHETIGVSELRHVQAVTERAIGGTPRAVQAYLHMWRTYTDAGLAAAMGGEDLSRKFRPSASEVDIRDLFPRDAEQCSRWEGDLRLQLDTSAADAPFSPWTAAYGLGDGVVLCALAETGRAMREMTAARIMEATNRLLGLEEVPPGSQPLGAFGCERPAVETSGRGTWDEKTSVRAAVDAERLFVELWLREIPKSLFVGCFGPALDGDPFPVGDAWRVASQPAPGAEPNADLVVRFGDGPQHAVQVKQWFRAKRLGGAWAATALRRGTDDAVLPSRWRSHRFLAALHQQLAEEETHHLDRISEVFGLNDGELGKLFGVTRQAIGNWRGSVVPSGRQAKVVTVLKTADVLAHNLKVDRIPGIARKSADAYGGLSMLDLIANDRHEDLLQMVTASFDWSAGE
jgi:hypothetical protein